jgi:hypothetical protein
VLTKCKLQTILNNVPLESLAYPHCIDKRKVLWRDDCQPLDLPEVVFNDPLFILRRRLMSENGAAAEWPAGCAIAFGVAGMIARRAGDVHLGRGAGVNSIRRRPTAVFRVITRAARAATFAGDRNRPALAEAGKRTTTAQSGPSTCARASSSGRHGLQCRQSCSASGWRYRQPLPLLGLVFGTTGHVRLRGASVISAVKRWMSTVQFTCAPAGPICEPGDVSFNISARRPSRIRLDWHRCRLCLLARISSWNGSRMTRPWSFTRIGRIRRHRADHHPHHPG